MSPKVSGLVFVFFFFFSMMDKDRWKIFVKIHKIDENFFFLIKIKYSDLILGAVYNC